MAHGIWHGMAWFAMAWHGVSGYGYGYWYGTGLALLGCCFFVRGSGFDFVSLTDVWMDGSAKREERDKINLG